MNNNEMLLLSWYKGSEDSPWAVGLEDSNQKIHEITVGENGRASAGPHLTEDLKHMNNSIYRYPMHYDMRQVRNRVGRTVEVNVTNNRINTIETNVHFTKEIKHSFKQTPFVPITEKVKVIEDSRYIESIKTENHLISTRGYVATTPKMRGSKNRSLLLSDYEENTNVFWVFMKPDNLKTISGNTFEGYIDAYNWPEGYLIPDKIGEQNIKDSQRTVRIELLGVDSFSNRNMVNKYKAKAYKLHNNNEEDKADIEILQKVGKESKEYLDTFIDSDNYIAVSIQYSNTANKPISINENVLGVAYSTDFKDLEEVKDSILTREFEAININKSMLKETYSKNNEIKERFPNSKAIPLVEYSHQTGNEISISTEADIPSKIGINPASWIDEVGIKEPPTAEDYSISMASYDDMVTDEEAMIEDILENTTGGKDTTKTDKGFNKKDKQIHGYTNNDLSFIPAKDDRLESGEIYGDVYIPDVDNDTGALPYDYTHKVRIGDVMFEVPPLSIRSDKEQANQSVATMRSRNAMQKGIGTTRQVLTLDLYFHDLENINGHEYEAFTRGDGQEIYYYMDGLRSLLAQFIKSPFVPIDNEYINNSLGIDNVAMRDIQAQTIEGFPEALSVTLILEEIDLATYLMGESSLGSTMNYPLYRWYYQQALNKPKKGFNKNTYLPPIKKLDNRFSFKIADESFLEDRTSIIREFNGMQKPRFFKKELEKEHKKQNEQKKADNEESVSENERLTSESATLALASYKKYQAYYNGLSKKTKAKYAPGEFPIITHSGQKKNLKHGKMQELPNEEYEIALEAGRKIYGERVNSGSIVSEPYNIANGKAQQYYINMEDSIFIGGYQTSNVGVLGDIIKKNKIPGFIQVRMKDKKTRKRFEKLLREVDDLEFKSGVFSSKYLLKSSILVPAGKVGGIDFLAELTSLTSEFSGEIEEKVDKYTKKYNDLADIVNSSEEDLPMHEFTIDNLIPLSLNVGISNNLSLVQTQAAKTPSLQYLGAQQPEIQITFSTTDRGAKQVDELFRKIGSYAKKYRTGIVSNFLEIKNPLVNMFGITSVLPNVFQINTVDGQPDEKIITLILVGFDKTQRRQEALNTFTSGKTTTDMANLHLDNFDPQVNALYIHEKIRNMELYPDLELPTFGELQKDLKYLKSGVSKLENRRNQVYLDPDFYVSTSTTMRKELNEILGNSEGTEVTYQDDFGIKASSNPRLNKEVKFTKGMSAKVKELDDSQELVDPFLEWEGYEESKEDESDGTQLDEILNGPAHYGTQHAVSKHVKYDKKPRKAMVNSWNLGTSLDDISSGKGNPDTTEVFTHLFNEVVRIWGNDKNVTGKDLMKNDFLGSLWDTTKKKVENSFKWNVFEGEVEKAKQEKEDGVSVGQGIKNSYDTHLDDSMLYRTFSGRLDKKLSKKEMAALKLSPVAFFSNKIGSGRLFNEDSIGSQKKLINGIGKEIDEQNLDNFTDLKVDKKIPLMRIFLYMKTLINEESDWRQFDSDGKPLVTVEDSDGKAYKVGIMGAPIAKAVNPSEAEKVSWNWKYNITFSLNKMRGVYNAAFKNKYFEFNLRAIDWAVASHSGMKMPKMLYTPTKENDLPYTPGQLIIAPESLVYFRLFSNGYLKEVNGITTNDAASIFQSPDGYNKKEMEEEFSMDADKIEDLIEDSKIADSYRADEYNLQQKIEKMYVDMQEFDHVGRLVRAFPSFTMMLIDEGKWFQNYRTWDNFYGYNSLISIDVYKSRKIAADTAIIKMSNMYGNLTSAESNPGPDLPAFWSPQFFNNYIMGKPTQEIIDNRAEVYDQMMLQTGARVHLRMGYGADAGALPVMFNGSISEMSTGEEIEITAQGDAVELQNVISGETDDSNVGLFNRVQEPRRTIGELMTSKGNWLKEMLNEATNSTFFKEIPSGIVHFGSTVESEKGNRAILPGKDREEFGESLQNVYSQNGMETKSQWHFSDGKEIGKMQMLIKHAQGVVTSMGILLGATAPFDEDNIGVSYYGRTVWDIIQTFALASQDYVSIVEPFEFRSTVFFGKPHWMMQYKYDSNFVYDSDRKMLERVLTKPHEKTFTQAHVYNSHYNIITNNVMTSEAGIYNNVIITYDGRQAGPIQADSDIRLDKQRTIDIEANILAPRGLEYFRAESQALVYGQSTVRDFMKDMYKGSYTVIGDPSVTPHDIVHLNDDISDIHGIHLVKAVHHSMTAETGFITTIEPDAYIYNFDKELAQIPGGVHVIGKRVNMAAMGKVADKNSGAYVLGSVVNKLMKTIDKPYEDSIFGGAKPSANKELMKGTNIYAISILLEAMSNDIQMGGQGSILANDIRKATSLEEVKENADKVLATWLVKEGIHVGGSGAIAVGGIQASKLIFYKATGSKIVAAAGSKLTANATVAKLSTAATGVGQTLKIAATAQLTIAAIAVVGVKIATAWAGEWWHRKKQNAEAIKVVPLQHKGENWTALMNWHKGSVVGDEPSLKDKLMNAEFFDEDIDPEVNKVFGNGIFKLLNMIAD